MCHMPSSILQRNEDVLFVHSYNIIYDAVFIADIKSKLKELLEKTVKYS